MVRHHLFRVAIGDDSLMENTVGFLHIGVLENAKSGDKSGGIVFEEDDLLVWFFEPVCMPEAVAVSSFVAYPFSSSLFM
jgi:hypothetical protein